MSTCTKKKGNKKHHRKNHNYRNPKTILKLIRKLKAANMINDKDQIAKVGETLFRQYLRLIGHTIKKRIHNKDAREDMFDQAYLLLVEAALKFKLSMSQYHPDTYFRNALEWGFYKEQLKGRPFPVSDRLHTKLQRIRDYMIANGGVTDYDSHGVEVFFPWTDAHKKACSQLIGVTVPTLDAYISYLWLEKVGSVEALCEESEKYEDTGLGDKSPLLADESGDPENQAMESEMFNAYNRTIANLPEKQRLAFLAMNREGCKNNIRQAALYLGWSADKVSNHYNKALTKLQEAMAPYLKA